MNKLPLISVLIPVYNVETFVLEALTSICNQTYDNLEIIVVDDCSTDSTYEIIEQIRKNDNRIKLFKNPINSKIAETLNFAIQQSNGEFIARMDGDDISKPSRIEKLYCYLIDNPHIDLVGSQMETIDENGKLIGFSKMPTNESNVYQGLNYKMSTVAHIWLARRKVYQLIPNYRIPSAEDYDFLLRLKTMGLRFTNVPEYLYQVRIRDGNTASSQGLKQLLSSYYAFKLYQERLNTKSEIDNYSIESFKKNTSSSSFSNYFHSISVFFLHKAIKSKDFKLRMYCFLILAMLFSPYYQFLYLFNRFKMNKLEIS